MDKEAPFVSSNTAKKKSTLVRNLIIAGAGIVLVAVGLILYFSLVKPAEKVSEAPDVVYDGEYFDSTTKTLMLFPTKTREDVRTIEIKNKSDHYYLDAFVDPDYVKFPFKDGNIFLEKNSLMDIQNDLTLSLKNTSASISYLVNKECSEFYLSSYGLDEENRVQIVYKDGENEYVFYLGSYTEYDNGYQMYIRPDRQNEDGTYAVYSILAISISTTFEIRDHVDVELDATTIASVVVGSTSISTIKPNGKDWRVTVTCTEEELAKYGLDAESNPSFVNVTLNDGSTYKYYIGNVIPSKGGYYIMADGRRNVVDGVEYYMIYILNSSTAEIMLSESAIVCTTNIFKYLGSDVANISDFRLYRKYEGDEKSFLVVRAGIADETTRTAATSSYYLIYPSTYILNEDSYQQHILENLAYLTSDTTLGYDERAIEKCAKYGIYTEEDEVDKNYATVMYTIKDKVDDEVDDTYTILYFSEPTLINDTTYYYCYCPNTKMIGIVAAEVVPFVEYTVADFTNGKLYFDYINNTDSFSLIDYDNVYKNIKYSISGDERSFVCLLSDPLDPDRKVTRIDYETGKEVEGIVEYKFEKVTSGTYTYVNSYGDFEKFRNLYYVLITRSITTDYAHSYEISNDVTKTITTSSTPNDQPTSYYKYDSKGNIVKGSDGKSVQVRYVGGNIVCSNVEVKVAGSDIVLKYDTAYYNEKAGRFFAKIVDSFDGNEKPANYAYDSDNTLVVTTYLPVGTTGEYTTTEYQYDFHNIYNTVTRSDGKTVKQINQTYYAMYVTRVVTTYRINSDGSQSVVSQEEIVSEAPVLVRIAIIEKLYSDSDKFLSGIEFDRDIYN